MTPTRILVAALATLRLTRFSTSDWLGEWTIVGPAKRWAARHEAAVLEQASQALREHGDAPEPGAVLPSMLDEYDSDNPWTWQAKLVKGLDCPFCVGFWLGALVLLAEIVAPRIPIVRHLWRFAAGALALNYVTGHVSARIDG